MRAFILFLVLATSTLAQKSALVEWRSPSEGRVLEVVPTGDEFPIGGDKLSWVSADEIRIESYVGWTYHADGGSSFFRGPHDVFVSTDASDLVTSVDTESVVAPGPEWESVVAKGGVAQKSLYDDDLNEWKFSVQVVDSVPHMKYATGYLDRRSTWEKEQEMLQHYLEAHDHESKLRELRSLSLIPQAQKDKLITRQESRRDDALAKAEALRTELGQ